VFHLLHIKNVVYKTIPEPTLVYTSNSLLNTNCHWWIVWLSCWYLACTWLAQYLFMFDRWQLDGTNGTHNADKVLGSHFRVVLFLTITNSCSRWLLATPPRPNALLWLFDVQTYLGLW